MHIASRWARLVARIAIVAIAVVVLAGSAARAVDMFRAPVESGVPYRTLAGAWSARFACVAAEVEAQVPRGSAVYISPDQPVDSGLWYQRLSEMVYPYAQQTASREGADVEVGIAPAPDAHGCADVQLVVTPRP